MYWTTLKIVKLKKLKYFSAPPRDINALGRRAVVEIAERCQTLQPLDYQEGYFFDGEDISQIVHANPWLTSLLIPFSYVYNNTVMFIAENLSNLRYMCICKMDITQECVQRIKSSKANLEICCYTRSWLCKICEPFQPEIPDPKIKATHKVNENLTFKILARKEKCKILPMCSYSLSKLKHLNPSSMSRWGNHQGNPLF